MTDLIQQRVRTAVQAALDKKAFDLNGYVGIVYFVATAASLYLG